MFYKWDDIVIYMRLERVGTTFKIKTWKYKELEYPKRVIPVDVNENNGKTVVNFINVLSQQSVFILQKRYELSHAYVRFR